MKKFLCLLMPLFTACFSDVPSPSGPMVTVNGTSFSVELAQTPAEQTRGLMYRESMPDDAGMLFIFDDARPRRFWMKNTKIPLDIVYLDEAQKVIEVIPMQPCVADPCPSKGPKAPAKYVLEVNLGAFPGRVGDVVEFAL